MKSIFHFLLFIIVFLFLSCSRDDPYKGAFPSIPTVFYLGRNDDYPDIERILNSVRGTLFARDEQDLILYENIIVVDEPDYWEVSFHVRGNGNLDSSIYGKKVRIMDGNFVAYVSKMDYRVVEKVKDHPITYVPHVRFEWN